MKFLQTSTLLLKIVETAWKGSTIVGESPVNEIFSDEVLLFLSKAGHVKPCLNLGRPLSKTKY